MEVGEETKREFSVLKNRGGFYQSGFTSESAPMGACMAGSQPMGGGPPIGCPPMFATGGMGGWPVDQVFGCWLCAVWSTGCPTTG